MTYSGQTMRLSVLAAIAAFSVNPLSMAATPPSGTIDGNNQSVAWEGPTPPPPPTAEAGCDSPNDPDCDHFRLTVEDPGFPFVVKIEVDQGGGDWDLSVFNAEGQQIGSSANAPGALETVSLPICETGDFTISASPFAAGVPTYTGVAAFSELSSCSGGGGDQPPGDLPNVGPFITTAPISVRPNDPDWDDYAPSFGEENIGGDDAGEPSIGIPHSNNAILQQTQPTKTRTMYIALLDTLRATFDECTSPPQVTWENKNVPTHVTTLDPILETDHETSRTFSSQLAGKTSLLGFSDDEGDSWTPSQGAGINSGVDHQTIGVGTFPPGDPGGVGYPNAVYYASQDVVTAQAALSRDGGLTFGPAVPMYDLTQCGGLHGHIEISPADGTVYVPNGSCFGESGFAISEDAGITWETPRVVPGTGTGDDPGMGVATDGTIYFAQCRNAKEPVVAVSKDKGLNWTQPVRLGDAFGIQQCVFPAVAAGDSDRAAVFFLGSAQAGQGTSSTGTGEFEGTWEAYVSVTYDGGETWTTMLASPPGDPVQRGQICLGGTTCESNRNLLDFNDIQEDRKGRIYIAYADGCVGPCVNDPDAATTEDVARIGRLRPGIKGLFAEFDEELAPSFPTAPRSPYAEATASGGNAEVRWSIPFDGGEPIREFMVFRQTDVEPLTLIATTGPDQQAFLDQTVDLSQNPVYEVLAANFAGTSQAPVTCDNRAAVAGEPAPMVEDNPCGFPGVRVSDDDLGDQDQTIGTSAHDIDWVAMHEKAEDTNPQDGQIDEKLFFIMKMANLDDPLPANTNWRMDWEAPNGVVFFVAMETDELSQVSFTYGWLDDSSGQNIFQTVGDADFGTFNPDGTIQITNSLSKFEAIETGSGATGMEPGATLANVTGTTQMLVGAAGTGLLATVDDTPPGAYGMIGNQACANNPPVARDDSAMTTQNESVLIDVLANDSDPDGDPLSLTGFRTDANNGEAVVVSGETGEFIEYRPDEGFTGEDSFEYTVRDDKGAEDSALVTVTVKPSDGGGDDGGNGGGGDPAEPGEVECDAAEMTQSGPWQTRTTGDGERYCRNVGHRGMSNPDKRPFVEFDFAGSATEVGYDYFTNPRGGVVEVIVDGESRDIIDQHRDGPDDSGQKDLVSERRSYTVESRSEPHTIRVLHRTDLESDKRNIAYVDGFFVSEGAAGSARSQSQESGFTGEMAAGESREHTIRADADTVTLAAVVEPVDIELFGTGALEVELLDPLGLTISVSDQLLAPEVVRGIAVVPGAYTVRVTNTTDRPVGYRGSAIRTQLLP